MRWKSVSVSSFPAPSEKWGVGGGIRQNRSGPKMSLKYLSSASETQIYLVLQLALTKCISCEKYKKKYDNSSISDQTLHINHSFQSDLLNLINHMKFDALMHETSAPVLKKRYCGKRVWAVRDYLQPLPTTVLSTLPILKNKEGFRD